MYPTFRLAAIIFGLVDWPSNTRSVRVRVLDRFVVRTQHHFARVRTYPLARVQRDHKLDIFSVGKEFGVENITSGWILLCVIGDVRTNGGSEGRLQEVSRWGE